MSTNGGGEMETTYYDVPMVGIGEWMAAKTRALGVANFNIVHRTGCATFTTDLTLAEAIDLVDPSKPGVGHLEEAGVPLCDCKTVTVRVT